LLGFGNDGEDGARTGFLTDRHTHATTLDDGKFGGDGIVENELRGAVDEDTGDQGGETLSFKL
jgi:hypothetical protein